MKNKIITLGAFVACFFIAVAIPCSAATIFNDNFNGYSIGNIENQGGWIGTSSAKVQEASFFEGGKAISMSHAFYSFDSIEKTGTATADGKVTLYVKGYIGGTTHPQFQIQLKEGGVPLLSIKTRAGYGFWYYNADTGEYTSFGPPQNSDQWYAIQIEWRSSDHKARYRIDKESFSDWHGGLGQWQAGLDTVNIGIADGTGYVDAIQENFFTPVENPVLIVPGLMGTELKNGDDLLWSDLQEMFFNVGDRFLDPLSFNSSMMPSDQSILSSNMIKLQELPSYAYDYSNGLITELALQNYVEKETLFTFPYDWRYGVTGKYANGTTNVDLLAQKIQDILAQTGAQKIDIVAHSMGGLIAKKYVAENSSNHHINKAVFVGVPNTGAPKSIKVLLEGDSMGIPFLSQQEIKKISENMPAAYDLLPSQQYYNTKGSFVKIIDDGSLLNPYDQTETNLNYQEFETYLTGDHNKNTQGFNNAQSLHTQNFDNFDMRGTGVDLYAIDGCKTATLGGIVENRFKNILGQHITRYKTPTFIPGDGTVPLESATNLPINPKNKFYMLTGDHGKMMSQNGSRQQIVNLLAGSKLPVDESIITQDISQCQLNGRAISVFSPIDILVIDQHGNRLGNGPDGNMFNEIPNAAFEILGEEKFLYLPTDSGQVYTITIQGTGTGTYTITSQEIVNGKITKAEIFSHLPVTPQLSGAINLDSQTTLTVQPNAESQPETIFPSVTVNGQTQDSIAPQIIAHIVGRQVNEDFYRGIVDVHLWATDSETGLLSLFYAQDGGPFQTAAGDSANILLEGDGLHSISFFATDKAGNVSPLQTIAFTIDNANQVTITAPAAIAKKDFKKTSAIPIAFTLNDANGAPVSNAVATLEVNEKNAKPSGKYNKANIFKYHAASGQYIYNLSGKSLSPGANKLVITLNDGTSYPHQITLK